MQTLVFESAWDKTIAPEDRTAIEHLFQQTKQNESANIIFTPISQAYNHREDLLIMVLVHNFTDQLYSFQDLELLYKEKDIEIAKAHFSFPELALPPRTSMPWTFIFPKSKQMQTATLENGQLFSSSYGY